MANELTHKDPGAELTSAEFISSDGTGHVFESQAQGDTLYATSTTVLSRLAKDANDSRVLTNTGTNNNPAWAQVTLTTGVTGTLPVANGGSGATSLTDGGILLGSGTAAVTAMAVLADSEMIVGDGTTDPVAESGATLRTSIGVGTGDSPQLTGIELGHATDTTIARSGSGAITVEGNQVYLAGGTDVPVADGGTGASSLTDGGVLLGSGTNAVTAMAVLADSEMIVGDGTTDPVAESGATLRTSIGVGTGDSPQLTGIELGHASDSTITRGAAGLLEVEGVRLVTVSATQTLTNKTLTTPTIGSFANAGHDHADAAGGAAVASASTTASGIAELATTAETSTGSDTGRTITPDGLAGSVHGEKVIQMVVVDFATALTTGNGKFYFHVPSTLNGFNIVDVHAEVISAPAGSTIIIQLHNLTATADILSTLLTIDASETGSDTAATAAVISGSEDDLTTNDVIRVDIDQIGSSTAGSGLIVTLICRLP